MDILDEMKNENEKLEAKVAAAKAEKRTAALADAPVVEKRSEKLDWESIGQNMIEKRTVTIGSTAPVTIARQLAETLKAKMPILNYVNFAYGAGPNENIPVWGTEIGEPEEISEGGTLTEKTGAFKVITLTPVCWGMTVPVSQTALKFSAVDVAAEVEKGIQYSYSKKIANDLFNGTGSVKGILTLTGVNSVTAASATAVSITDMANLALAIKNVTDNGAIFINPSVYAAVTCNDASAKEKAWGNSFFNNKIIEGVPVVLASQMPSAMTTGSTVAVGGRFSDYSVAISGNLEIVEKGNVGKLVDNFDTNMYLAGTTPVPENFYKLCLA